MDSGARIGSTAGSHERIVGPDDALSRVFEYAKASGFSIDYSSVGSHLKTTTCDVVGPDGQTATGRGKGLSSQSVASAVFEALEHYYYKHETVQPKLVTAKLDTTGADVQLRDASPDFGLVFGKQSVPLSCLSFSGIRDSSMSLLFPIVLTNPAYQASSLEESEVISRTRIYRYSTNSGTASGLTSDDAILHGLLEVIERDAIGLLFMRSVLSPKPEPVREIAQESLPEHLRDLLSSIINETSANVTIWDVTTDIQVPAILCALSVGNGPEYRFFGSGASLSPAYAVERAALEALQGYHIQTHLGVNLQRQIRRTTDRMSLYQRCGLDAGYFAYRGGARKIEFCSLPDAIASGQIVTPRQQIDHIVSLLDAKCLQSYFRTIKHGPIYVVQVLVPNLERLFLLMHGLPVAPSSRGRAQAIMT